MRRSVPRSRVIWEILEVCQYISKHAAIELTAAMSAPTATAAPFLLLNAPMVTIGVNRVSDQDLEGQMSFPA